MGTVSISPALRPFIARVSQEFCLIPADRRRHLDKITEFAQDQTAANNPAQLVFVCTHNSRRSHLAALWAQTAAEYYGLGNVAAFSGGLEATACDLRTVRAMRRAGFSVVDSTGGSNPLYLIQYAEQAAPMRAFSKVLTDRANPKDNYLAVMTCGHADESCPTTRGSVARVSIPYEDPKLAVRHAPGRCRARRALGQIAREMFFVMAQVASYPASEPTSRENAKARRADRERKAMNEKCD